MITTINVQPELIAAKAIANEKIYLSDIFENDFSRFPRNAVFNKRITGIGGTQMCLDSKEDSIILMPFKKVVLNKVSTFPNIFVVLGGVTVEDIVDYLSSTPLVKIVGTYDSLSKIIEAYKILELDIYSTFILVDEWQVLYSQYELREKAFSFLRSVLKDFTNITFMSATPIEREYWFREMEHLQEVELNYELVKPNVIHYKVNSPEAECIALINKYKDKVENAHIFINSVKFIKDVLENCDITANEVRIVCADSKKNIETISSIEGNYTIGDTLDEVKKINFYTSTCFEGADLYDENGNIFIICDGTKAHTLVDISNQLPQIAGRIRNIQDNTVTLIYKTTRYNSLITFSEYKEVCIKQKEQALRLEDKINRDSDLKFLANKAEEVLNSMYLKIDNNKVKFDEMFLYLDEINFKIRNVYKTSSNVVASLNNNGFIPVVLWKKWETMLKTENKSKTSFEEKILTYHKLMLSGHCFTTEPDPFIKDCYQYLGFNKIKELEFSISKVKAALLKLKSPGTEGLNIIKLLDLRTGQFYTSKTLKTKLTSIYNSLGINKTAKGTDVLSYYEVLNNKEVSRKINGKSVKGYVVIKPKIIIK